jgi:hypothetical protein
MLIIVRKATVEAIKETHVSQEGRNEAIVGAFMEHNCEGNDD